MNEPHTPASKENEPKGEDDKFTLSYSLWLCLALLLFVGFGDLERMFRVYLLAVPPRVLLVLAVPIYFLTMLARNLLRHRWRRLASVLAAPFIAFGLFHALLWMNISVEGIGFALKKPQYLAQIGAIPRADGEPLLTCFDWGETGGAAVANFFYTIVYDESDEIALDHFVRSMAWNKRALNSKCQALLSIMRIVEDEHRSGSVRKVSGHFYMVTELFQ